MARDPTIEYEASPRGSGLEGLLTAHRVELLRFLAARCGDASEAEDLLQELWLKVRAASPGPIANARAYLFRAANNLVLDRARARHRQMRRDRTWLEHAAPGDVADRPDPAPDADVVLLAEEELAIVRAAVDALPPGAARALTLYRFEGRSQAEVAGIMGISLSGVEKHLALAMRKLRETLGGCGYFDLAASQDGKRAAGASQGKESDQ
jgi:RNA polymerase sigma factor (sigma-70 family)